MVRSSSTAALLALGLLRGPTCGDSVDNPNGQVNAPCTRSSDCGGSLMCFEGVCRAPDAGEGDDDAAASVAAPDANGDGGG